MEKYEFEEWKQIKGFEGLYEVSNYGRIKSLKTDKILKQQKHGNYLYVNSLKDYVHIIVANAFIPNKWKLPCVNHRDENGNNNCVWNLEWCTHKYNSNYGNCIKKIVSSKEKSVLQCNLKGEVISEYKSIKEASDKTGISNKSISNCCLKRYGYKTAGGYVWKFKEAA